MKTNVNFVITETALEQFALPCAREERISLVKIQFATRQDLQTNSKDALAGKCQVNFDAFDANFEFSGHEVFGLFAE
ncbi:hypothetical protein Mal48_28680 [Thalassoglobus polymorphus]|uniref:Uncharacterized protein n=1 Tax=Thalassoglobus polymorphus TaxID=2527994 RepID=A0A517QPU2_9PLAN|nr:hypothetical protein Mal48_28680 [Thalassoglobus polymorphus]